MALASSRPPAPPHSPLPSDTQALPLGPGRARRTRTGMGRRAVRARGPAARGGRGRPPAERTLDREAVCRPRSPGVKRRPTPRCLGPLLQGLPGARPPLPTMNPVSPTEGLGACGCQPRTRGCSARGRWGRCVPRREPARGRTRRAPPGPRRGRRGPRRGWRGDQAGRARAGRGASAGARAAPFCSRGFGREAGRRERRRGAQAPGWGRPGRYAGPEGLPAPSLR